MELTEQRYEGETVNKLVGLMCNVAEDNVELGDRLKKIETEMFHLRCFIRDNWDAK